MPNRLTWRSCRKILAHLSQELSLSPTILALLSQSWRNCRKSICSAPNSSKVGGATRGSVQRHWFGGYSRATVATYTSGSSCIVHHQVGSASSPKQVAVALLSQNTGASVARAFALPKTPGASVAKLAHLSQKPLLFPNSSKVRGATKRLVCNVTGSAVIAGQPWQRTRQDPHGLKVQLKDMKKVSRLGDPRDLSGSLERTFRGTWTLSTAIPTLTRTSS